jgi:hypothetical protein
MLLSTVEVADMRAEAVFPGAPWAEADSGAAPWADSEAVPSVASEARSAVSVAGTTVAGEAATAVVSA